MLLNIAEILSVPSMAKDYPVSFDFDSLKVRGQSYPVSHKEPFILHVSKTDKDLSIKGEKTVSLLIPCDRCLDDVENTFQLSIDYILQSNTEESDGIEDADEFNFIDGCMLDVDRLIKDELVVALPTKNLCREDCKGLCPVCGTNLNHGSCNCDKKVLDPRMAAIKDIFREFNDKNS